MVAVPALTRRAALAAPLALAACGGEHAAERARGILYGRALSVTPPKSPWDDQWNHFKAQIAKDPSIALDYFNRGETGPEDQQMFDLRRGRAHVGGPSLQGLSVIIPELTIAMAPYLFESEAEVDYVYDRHLLEVFRPLFRAKNLHLMQWVEVGWTNLYSNGAILTPADAAGQRLRGAPNRASQAFLRAIGADSVPLGSTELIPALQTGLITGGLGATVFHYFSTRDYATDLTLTKQSYDTGAIIFNNAWYEGASAAQRRTLDAAWMSSDQARASVRKLTQFAIDDMRKRGITVHELTPEQRALWVKATDGVAEALVAEIGGRSREVMDAILAGKRAFAAGRA